MSAALSRPQAAIDPATARSLLEELQKAHVIAHAMLQELSQEAKARLAAALAHADVSPDGVTRAHERATVIGRSIGCPAEAVNRVTHEIYVSAVKQHDHDRGRA